MSIDEVKENDENYDMLDGKYCVNSDSQSRYHANWLNMIYPRLKIAKDLLSEDGLIFISIDDYEKDNLVKICNEIFGNTSFSGPFIWSLPRGINAGLIARAHEYILCYTKGIAKGRNFYRLTDDVEYSVERCNKKIDARHPISDITFKKGIRYEGEDKSFISEIKGSEKIIIKGELCFKNGKLDKDVTLSAGWTMKNMILDWMSGKEVYDTKGQKIIEFYFKENGKLYSKKEMSTLSIKSVLKDIPDTQIARIEMEELLGSQDIFPYPKPTELIKTLIKLSTKDGDLVMDFFSGAATTAHSIIKQNVEDRMNRRFILVQISEQCAANTEAYTYGYKNICEIGKECIRRAGDKIKQEHPDADIDIGFKVFRVADTNIKWNSLIDMGQIDITQLETTPNQIDFMPGANDIDIVYEMMLRQRDVALSETLETLTDIGSRTYLYASSFLVCLETEVSTELIEKIAVIDPLPIKFIFRDSAFKDDIALKDETFRRLKALVEKNSGERKPAYTVEFI
jgi:adenine-specific DNA-methyltransferase